jgi:hypothetical protein
MHTVFIGIGPVFLVLFFGVVAYTNHRRRTRWREGSQPMPPPQPGSSESPSPAAGGMDYRSQPPLSSAQSRPPAPSSRPGWFKMVTPSRPTKILFGVAATLIVAGFLVVLIIANLDHSRPVPLPLLITVIATVGSGGLIVGGLSLAAVRRQSKGR